MQNLILTDNSFQQDVLILNQHGGGADFDFPPALQRWLDALGQSFRDFLETERDVGASELADGVFQRVANQGLRCAKIDVPFPRAVCDINRQVQAACSIPLPPELTALVEELHRETTRQILEFRETTRPRLVLDQHTMSPVAPTDDAGDPPHRAEQFTRHVELWNAAARTPNNWEVRPTCIMDSLADGTRIGHSGFSRALHDKLKWPGELKPAFNQPFAPDPARHQAHLFIGGGRGCAVDIPKHELTDTPRGEIDLAHLELSPTKVNRIAGLIADSILQVLSR